MFPKSKWWQRLTYQYSSPARKTYSRTSARAVARPLLERLEDRTLPSTFFVSKATGNDANNGLTAATAVRTIQHAIDLGVTDGDGADTINVETGVYNTAGKDTALTIPNNVTFLPSLQLLGGWSSGFGTRNPALFPTTYVDQSPSNIVSGDINVDGNNVTIDGFTFVFDGTPGVGGSRQSAGILAFGTNLTVSNNKIEVASSSAGTAADAYGLQTGSGSVQNGLQIHDNTFFMDATFASGGVYLNPGTTTGIVVKNNTFQGGDLSQGIAVDTISNVTVSGNMLTRTGSTGPLQLIFAGPFNGSANQTNVSITGNTLMDSNMVGDVGIEIGNTSGSAFTIDMTGTPLDSNTVQNSDIGILVSENSKNVTISNGRVTGANAVGAGAVNTGIVASGTSTTRTVDNLTILNEQIDANAVAGLNLSGIDGTLNLTNLNVHNNGVGGSVAGDAAALILPVFNFTTSAASADGVALSATQVQQTAGAAVAQQAIGYTGATFSQFNVFTLAGNDSITVNGTSTPTTVHGGDNDDLITVNGTSAAGPLTIFGDAGNNAIVVNASAGIAGTITVTGGAGNDTLTVNGGAGNDTFTITGLAVTGGGMTAPVNYSAIQQLIVAGNGGANTLNVQSTSTPTTVSGGAGNDTFNVSSNAPANSGTLTGLASPLSIDGGGGSNQLTVSESGSAVSDTVLVTSASISSLIVPFSISYAAAGGNFGGGVNLITGSAADTINIQSTLLNSPTSIHTGAGDDTINVSSNAPVNTGTLAGLAGLLAIDGGTGSNQLNVSESGSAVADTVLVTSGSIASALVPFTINYIAIGGSFGGGLNLLTGSAADTINVQTTLANSPTSVNSGGGNDTFNVSSNAPTDTGTLTGLAGTLSLNGGAGANQLTVSESGSATADTVLCTNGTIASTVVPFTVNYAATGGNFGGGIAFLSGSQADTINVQSTLANSPTFINAGAGNDTFNVSSNAPTNTGNLAGLASTLAIDGGPGANQLNVSESGSAVADMVLVTSGSIASAVVPFTINYTATGGSFGGGISLATGSAADTVNVQSTFINSPTFINTGAGNDSINVTSLGATLTGLAGPLNVDAGAGSNLLFVNESGSAVADTVQVTSTSISSTVVPFVINYKATLGNFGGGIDVLTGSAADTVNVLSTLANSPTFINTGDGNDSINVSSATGTLTGLAGVLSIDAGAGLSNQLRVSEGGSNISDTVLVTNSTIASALVPFTVNYTATGGFFAGGIGILTGSQADTINVQSTLFNSSTFINTGAGDDTINVSSNAPTNTGTLAGVSSLNIDAGAGANQLNVNESGDTTSDSVLLSSGDIDSTSVSFTRINFTATAGSFAKGIFLTTGSAADLVNVIGTPVNGPVFVNTGAGNDIVNVSSLPPIAGTLNGFASPLTVDGGAGSNQLNVSEFKSLNADSVLVTNASITSALVPFAVYYSASGGNFGGNINFFTGSGNNTINVQSTLANSTTVINGGAGNDTMNVSSDAGTNLGNLDGIQGVLTVNAGGGVNQLSVSDFGQTATTNANVQVFSNTIANFAGSGKTTPIYYSAAGGSFAGVRLDGSNVLGDTFDVRSTLVGSNTLVRGNGGNDFFNVGDFSNSLAEIQGQLVIGGGANNSTPTTTLVSPTCSGTVSNTLPVGDTLSINDQANAGVSTYAVTPGTVGRGGMSPISYINVETINLNTGSASNTINVATLASSNTTVNAGGGNDTINLTSTGTASNTVILGGGGDDSINVQSTGANSITYVFGQVGNDTVNVTNAGAGGTVTLGGPVFVDGGPGNNQLNIMDPGSAGNDSITVTNSLICGTTPAFSVAYANISPTIMTGAGADTINVSGTQAGQTTTIFTGAGNDVVNIGNGANSLGDIQGALNIDAGTHNGSPLTISQVTNCANTPILNNVLPVGDTVNFNDQGNAAAATYQVTATSLQRTDTAQVNFVNFQTVNINTGSNADAVNVAGTGASTSTVITAGPANDTIMVNTTGDNSLTVVHGGAGNNAITLTSSGMNSGVALDAGNGNNVFAVGTATSPGPNDGPGNGSVVDVTGGSGNDTFNLGPNPMAQIKVDGGGGANSINFTNLNLPKNKNTFQLQPGKLVLLANPNVVVVCYTNIQHILQTAFVASSTLLTNADGTPVVNGNNVPQFTISLTGSPLLPQGLTVRPNLPAFIVAPIFGNPFGYTAPSVTVADFNGDGIPDLIVGLGAGFDPLVTVFDGAQLFVNNTTAVLAQFFAFAQDFRAGIFVAAGDVNGDGKAEIITGAGAGGGPDVRVWSYDPASFNGNLFPTNGATLLADFFAYDPGFSGGVRVATGNIFDHPGYVDLITAPGPGGGPHVKVFDGMSLFASPTPVPRAGFFAYDPNFSGGVYVAAGDYGSLSSGIPSAATDGFDDILTGPGMGGGPEVKVFDGKSLAQGQLTALADFMAFSPQGGSTFPLANGVNGVGFSTFDNISTMDNHLDIIVGSGPGMVAETRIFDGAVAPPLGVAPPLFGNGQDPDPNPQDPQIDPQVGDFVFLSFVDNLGVVLPVTQVNGPAAGFLVDGFAAVLINGQLVVTTPTQSGPINFTQTIAQQKPVFDAPASTGVTQVQLRGGVLVGGSVIK